MRLIEPSCWVLVLGMFGCAMPIPTTYEFSGAGGSTTYYGLAAVGGATTVGQVSSAGVTQSAEIVGGTDAASACSEVFTACGGDPTGIWDIESVCIDGDLIAATNADYASISTVCAQLCSGATLSARGAVTYNAGNFEANAILGLSETLGITAECYAALSGSTSTSASCTNFMQNLNEEAGTVAACSTNGTGCDCSYTTAVAAAADTYSISGTMLVASDGTTTEFCVQGSTMTQRDSFGEGAYVVTSFKKR